jgi:hypothetical protein
MKETREQLIERLATREGVIKAYRGIVWEILDTYYDEIATHVCDELQANLKREIAEHAIESAHNESVIEEQARRITERDAEIAALKEANANHEQAEKHEILEPQELVKARRRWEIESIQNDNDQYTALAARTYIAELEKRR